MKTRIKLLSVLMMLFVSMSLVSCSDDDEKDDDTGASIIGLWEYENAEKAELIQIYFYPDGTFYYYMEEWGANGENPEWEDTGEYTYKNDLVTLSFVSGDVDKFQVLELTENTLIMKYPGDWEIYDFYRVD